MSIIPAWFIGYGLAFVACLWFIGLMIEFIKDDKNWAAIACFLVAIGLSYGSVQVAQKITTDVAVSYYKRGQVDGLNYCIQIAEEIKNGR